MAFHDAIRTPTEQRAEAGVTCPYEQIAFYSRRQPTALSARLESEGLGILAGDPFSRTGTDAKSGDGTVPWFSAYPIEWNDDAQALSAPSTLLCRLRPTRSTLSLTA
jgi:hypothetical protein